MNSDKAQIKKPELTT